jgi:hypothetical protein
VSAAPGLTAVLSNDGRASSALERLGTGSASFDAGVVRIVNASREEALERTRSGWVTFLDPVSPPSRDHLLELARSLEGRTGPASAIVYTPVVDVDASGRTRNRDPLRARFTEDVTTAPLDLRGDGLRLGLGGVVLRAELLHEHGLGFDPAAEELAEDLFVGRYLLAAGADEGGEVVYLPRPVARRAASDHERVAARARRSPATFARPLEHGCLPLIEATGDASGPAPLWLQRFALEQLGRHLRVDARLGAPTAALDVPDVARFLDVARRVVAAVDPATIEAWGGRSRRAVVLRETLHALGGSARTSVVQVGPYDRGQQLLALSYFLHGPAPHERFVVDGEDVPAVHGKYQGHRWANAELFRERHVWIPAGPGAEQLQVVLAGQVAPLTLRRSAIGRQGSDAGPRLSLPRATRARPRRDRGKAPVGRIERVEVRGLRWLARQGITRRVFSGAWLLMDRDGQANDNAEHLYRWLRRERPEINAWFLLARGSADWDRLKGEGFRLLPHGGRRSTLALLQADHLISSHADRYVVDPIPRHHYGDRMTWRFTFLQHGVLVSDLSTWLNGKEIDRFITSSPAEYDEVVRDGSPYRFTTKEVELTGLPRHDALLARAKEHAEQDLILVAPTWRNSLVASETRQGNARSAAESFYGSAYAQRWRAFLHSERLRELAMEHGRQVAFMPHVNVLPYLGWFDLPDHVRVLDVSDCDIQGALSRCVVAITDYSSLVFDAAYLRRQVIYYQFDRRAFYGGEHLWRPGHFSFKEDGFGPVVEDEAELHGQLAIALQHAGPVSPYVERMRQALPFQDGRACERVVASIDRLGPPQGRRP